MTDTAARDLDLIDSSFRESFIQSTWSKFRQSTYCYVPQDVQHRFYANTRCLFSRFQEIAENPFDTAPDDLQLLLLSIWRGKQLGPDVVYPMLRIRKRQSGRLAKLILEYAKTRDHHERYAETAFPPGIDPPCVATININDEGSHLIARNRHSTRDDLFGLIFKLISYNATLELCLLLWVIFMMPGIMSQLPTDLWTTFFTFHLLFCIYAVSWGEGTLSLALRSNTSIPGSAVLFDQDFTVVLNGSQVVLEAIAESSFNLSHPDHVGTRIRVQRDEECPRDLSNDPIEHTRIEVLHNLLYITLCGLYLVLWATPLAIPLQVATTIINVSYVLVNPADPDAFSVVKVVVFQFYVTLCSLWHFEHLAAKILLLICSLWHTFSFVFFLTGYQPRDYPISTARLLDALGRPSVKKWQFDTFAAAATFQCLVICHRIPRPVDHIDVFAFLDMLVPDQRDVWKAWKERVADRITHETDILFAPTISTFGDERQVQLGDLLREAQSGYDVYRAFYDSDQP